MFLNFNCGGIFINTSNNDIVNKYSNIDYLLLLCMTEFLAIRNNSDLNTQPQFKELIKA